MIREALAKVVEREDLSEQEMVAVMDEIMSGSCTGAQIGAFITALRMKGETVEEITGAAKVMREKALRVEIESDLIVDTCGTGGDAASTFNVSTAAALVIAASGLKVAKHGNRAVSSSCGSADIIEALGGNLELSPEQLSRCIEKVGFSFLFAPRLHLAMKHAIGPRREVGLRTVFNILGPLTNPAHANIQVLGVYDRRLTNLLARVLKNLGSKAAMVVFGQGGFDEISIVGPTFISELKNGEIEEIVIEPEHAGLKRARPDEIEGGNLLKNVEIINSVLSGKKGAHRDIVALNAAAGLTAAGKVPDIKQGVQFAGELIDSGAVKRKLEEYVDFCKNV